MIADLGGCDEVISRRWYVIVEERAGDVPFS
jgi:hypothetical protein